MYSFKNENIGGAYVGRKSILELFGEGRGGLAGGPAMIGQKSLRSTHTRAHIYT